MNYSSRPHQAGKSELSSESESKLQRQFNYALTTLGRDLSEVFQSRICEGEALARITRSRRCTTSAVREGLSECRLRSICQHQRLVDWRPHTFRVERQVNVTVAGVSVVNILRECLVEDIEEPGAELEILLLFDLEILEQRDIPVCPIRRAEIEWRNRCSR